MADHMANCTNAAGCACQGACCRSGEEGGHCASDAVSDAVVEAGWELCATGSTVWRQLASLTPGAP